MHKHRAKHTQVRAFSGQIPGASPNPSAHGWTTVVDTCSCGAVRFRNVNGRHVERGPWEPIRATHGARFASMSDRAWEDFDNNLNP